MEIAKLVLEYIQALIWPGIVLFIAIYFKKETSALLGRIRSAKLPGGVSFDLNEKIREVEILSNEVQETITAQREEHKEKPTIPLTEANARLIQLGLRPSPSGMDIKYYLDIARQDPNLSLAGLRIEIDILVKNLTKGIGIQINEKHSSTMHLLKKLLDAGHIYKKQYELIVKVLSVCNQAIHGCPVTYEQAHAVIVSAEALANDFVAWMSWGFNDNWRPSDGG